MLSRALLCMSLLTILCGAASAQSRIGQSPIAGADRSASGSESSMITGSPQADMFARREIKVAEKRQLENLERAREVAQISVEVRNAFDKNQTLSRIEIKKIERLEKLARRIREQAGGSDGEVTIINPPRSVEAALVKMAELSEVLRKGVEKTPRQVISASVIERTNELLDIIRYVRGLIR